MTVELILARRALLLIAVLVCIAAAALVAFIYLPQATIVIHPSTTNRTLEQTIILSATAQEPDFVRFVLPARPVVKEVNQNETFTRTDASIKDDFAKGQITLRNDQVEPQSLLPKTHLKHEASGAFFLTDAPVRIPAQGEVAVSVTAEAQGAIGNVPPGKFIVDKLPASLQALVYGTSTTTFSGGTIVESPLTQQEIDTAKKQVVEKAKTEALGQLTAASGGAHIKSELLSVQPISEQVSAEVGSKTSAFSVSTTVKATGFIVDENDLLSLTLLALRKSASQDEEFLSYDPQSFRVSIEAADFERGQAQIKGSVTGTFGHKIGLAGIETKNIAGLSAPEIEEAMKKIPGIGSVEVSFSPFWVKTAPSRPQAIKTEIQATGK